MIGGRGRGRATCLCLLASVGLSSSAAAQGPAPGTQAPSRRAAVTAVADVFGGWDRSLTPGRPLATGGDVRSTTYGGANSALVYDKAFESSAVNVRLTAAGRYLPRARPSWTPSYGADLSWASVGRRRWSWSLIQSLSFRPPNAGVLFAGGLASSGLDLTRLPLDGVDYLLDDSLELASATSGSLGFALSRRDRFTVSAGGGGVVGSSGSTARYRRLSAGASLEHQLSRYGGLRVGYRYDESRTLDRQSQAAGVATRGEIHGVDAGVFYARPLPFSQETTVDFNSGFVGVPRRGRWEYTAVGSGGLTRIFKRRWSASLNGARTVRFVPTFAEPTLVNTVSAGLAGSKGRRITFNLGANYATGRSGYRDTAIPFDAYSGQAQWRLAATRRLGLFVEYFYFLASIQGDTQSQYPSGELSRHGVRVGGSFGTDLFGRR